MKIEARGTDLVIAVPDPGADAEHRTRVRVCREVLERGPVSAAQLAKALGLTPAAVRRHLDALLGEGHVAVWEEPPGPSRRGRGRPARRFVGTDAGHGAMSTGYGELATAALRFLAELAGAEAVRGFADRRMADLERRYLPALDAAGGGAHPRTEALARLLSADGYAASARPLELHEVAIGTQLCQGHCPVHQVAREFPQLCEAETEAFSRLLGVHVQRLATLAHGEHVCTTYVPSSTPGPDSPAGRGADTAAPGASGTVHHERTT